VSVAELSRQEMVARGHPVWAEIDLDALRHNVRTLAALAPGAELMGVVKGYAYGHGNPVCAREILAAGARRLGVARVAEALHLREAGIAAPIHVFTEPPPQAAPAIVEHDLVATVYTQAFAQALEEAAARVGRRIPVHVKVDTGMHRVGLMVDDVPGAVAVLRALRHLEIEGVWSHLAVADVPDHPFTDKQLELFAAVLDELARAGVEPRYRHIANSAALIARPDSHLDLVRPGAALYGLSPGPALAGAADLRPVMALKARVNMVKKVPAGERLSYGLAYELSQEAFVVTVPAGYADGYDRRLSGRADVLLRGSRYKVSGAVCMDQFMVDLGPDPAEVGDVVTLLGADGDERITADELAELIGTINYEVTARVPSRVPRLYVSGSGA
jgi:alanine racemase